MENLPLYVSSVFILTVLLAVWLFYKATRRSRSVDIVCGVWLTMQGVLGAVGFYEVINPIPPRFPLLLVPPMLAICVLFITRKGRAFLDDPDLRTLTLFHIIRIPVSFAYPSKSCCSGCSRTGLFQN